MASSWWVRRIWNGIKFSAFRSVFFKWMWSVRSQSVVHALSEWHGSRSNPETKTGGCCSRVWCLPCLWSKGHALPEAFLSPHTVIYIQGEWHTRVLSPNTESYNDSDRGLSVVDTVCLQSESLGTPHTAIFPQCPQDRSGDWMKGKRVICQNTITFSFRISMSQRQNFTSWNTSPKNLFWKT